MSKKKEKRLKQTTECLNCHTPIGNQNFCPNCGQQNVDKQASLRDFLHDVLGDFLTFDHKFFRSFKPLLFKPGFLTKEYNNGRRANYILPLRLYIFVSLVFFFVYTLKDSSDSSIINVSKTNTELPEDTVANFLFQFDNVDSLKAFRLNTLANSHFDQIRLNSDGQDWDNFFINDYPVSDSLRNVLAYLLYFRYELDLEIEPKNSSSDSLKFMKTVTDKPYLISDTMATSIFKRLDMNYELDRNYFHSNMNSWRYLKREVRELFPDTVQADYARRELLINFSFKKNENNIQSDLTEVDSTKWYGFLKDFGRQIEEQGRRVNKMENSSQIITREFFNQLPKIIFFLLPIFALILKLFYLRRKIFYINHLIFALHSHTIIFIYLFLGVIADTDWLYAILIPGIWFHLFFSLRNVYGQSRIMSFLKLNSIFFIYLFFVLIGMLIALLISFFQV